MSSALRQLDSFNFTGLKISVGPVVSLLLIGHPKAVLKAVVNETDLSLVKFQWFKLNEVTNTVEVIDGKRRIFDHTGHFK